MSVYKNIDGTSKKSFKISSRGVELSTGNAVTVENGKKIHDLLADGKIVYTKANENQLFIDRKFISEFEYIPGGCEITLKYYSTKKNEETGAEEGWIEEKLTIKTVVENVGLKSSGETSEDHVALWGEGSGESLKDSGYYILSELQFDSDGNVIETFNDKKGLITYSTMKQYVEGKEVPLKKRLSGATAREFNAGGF